MFKSCETLIIKINEWQKAILELEELSDEFLNSGDTKLKPEINSIRQGIKNLAEEYQELAYPELPNGQTIFWPEKEFLEEVYTANINEFFDYSDCLRIISGGVAVEIKNNHVNYWTLPMISEQFTHLKLNLSLFKGLEIFIADRSDIEKFPVFPQSIKNIGITDCKNIQIPDDLTHLDNLEIFYITNNANVKKFPKLPKSIKEIKFKGHNLSYKEKQRIKKEYPNAEIEF